VIFVSEKRSKAHRENPYSLNPVKIRSPPTPMKSDSKYQVDIQTSRGPESLKEQKELERRMGFSYRQTIGELIYALTVCRVDISIAVITLSQHSHRPAQVHYEAVKQVFAYLNATKRDGLTYWRPQPQMDLPIALDPSPISAPSQLYNLMINGMHWKLQDLVIPRGHQTGQNGGQWVVLL
jgi:hypothetical protein